MEKSFFKKNCLGIIIIISTLLFFNQSFAQNVEEKKESAPEKVSENMDLELNDVFKSIGNQYIAHELQFSTKDSKSIITANAKPFQPKAGMMFALIKMNLINPTDKKIKFKLGNLKATAETEDKIRIMYLTTFDDNRKSYSLFNFNPPEVEPHAKKEIRILTILKDTCPKITLQYSEGKPLQVKLASLPLSKTGSEQVKDTEHKQKITVRLGKQLTTKFKGKTFKVYATRVIPGVKIAIIAHAKYDELPRKIQKYAAKKGYGPGSYVDFVLGEKSKDTKILPAKKK